MTAHGDSDEPGGMHSSLTIAWRPTDVRDLLEARLVDGDGSALYAGYIVRRAGDGDDEWHGYTGITHVLVAVGTRESVQAAVERAARETWAARQSAKEQHSGRCGAEAEAKERTP